MSGSDGSPPVGSVAEEAAKLFGALSGWAREQSDGAADAASSGSSATGAFTDRIHEHLATGAPECDWCPVCRTVAAVRHTSPEVRAHLASAASSLLLAVSGMMATRPPTGDASRVQHIDLDDPADRGADEAFDEPEDVR